MNCNDEERIIIVNHMNESYIEDHFVKEYNRTIEYSPLSIYTNHDCIIDFQHMDYLTEEVENEFRHNDELYVVFAMNMLDYPTLDIHERLANEIRRMTSNEVLLLNLETENIDYFNTSIKEMTELNTSRYHHYQYPAVFQEALRSHLYHRLSNWISPWDNAMKKMRVSNISLYSNIDDTQNAGVFIVNNVTVGVIMYSTAVFNELHIISSEQLIRWIHAKAKCMRKLSVDVIIVMGDGDIQFSKLVLNESHHYVTTVLGVESNSHSCLLYTSDAADE